VVGGARVALGGRIGRDLERESVADGKAQLTRFRYPYASDVACLAVPALIDPRPRVLGARVSWRMHQKVHKVKPG